MLSRRNEYAECEALLAQALNMCIENNEGPTDCRMQQILGELDEISWKQGRIREADVLENEYMDFMSGLSATPEVSIRYRY